MNGPAPAIHTATLSTADSYPQMKAMLAGRALPAALIDLDRVEANAHAMLTRAGNLPIRLGSKSIRCTAVMRLVQSFSTRFQGLLCFSAREAAWLAKEGFDDLLVAYPTVDKTDLGAVAAAVKDGKKIALMVDDPAQIEPLQSCARALQVCFRLAIDIDMSSSFPGLHFGMRRSPVTTPRQALQLAEHIARAAPDLKLVGVMGYEGQIAGLQDDVPGKAAKNLIVRRLKQRSIRELSARRQSVVEALKSAGFALEFVNGGGTGSLESTAGDASVTEIAAGSGLYSPALFDHFSHFHHAPAAFFALQAVRRPLPDIVTCLGGGYIASGPIGNDRLPLPWLPQGLSLLPQEGAGEVQTPVQGAACRGITLGDPVFFRHAKAGEMAERFNRFLLIRNGEVVDDVPTYRGQGQCFF